MLQDYFYKFKMKFVYYIRSETIKWHRMEVGIATILVILFAVAMNLLVISAQKPSTIKSKNSNWSETTINSRAFMGDFTIT